MILDYGLISKSSQDTVRAAELGCKQEMLSTAPTPNGENYMNGAGADIDQFLIAESLSRAAAGNGKINIKIINSGFTINKGLIKILGQYNNN